MRCKSQLHKYHEITYLFDKLFHEVQLYMRLAIASKAFFKKELDAVGLMIGRDGTASNVNIDALHLQSIDLTLLGLLGTL